jgi:delta 1-pyrroline-5-carboxylate dehydrogenase
MRLLGKLFVVMSLALAVGSMVVGQPPGGQPPGGQPPGGKGQKGKGGKGKGGQQNDYMTLLKNPGVKDELKVTDQQMDKLPAALQKALAEVLTDKQLQRLREIYLQQRGNSAFLDADIKEQLKITPDQLQKIQAALDFQTKEQNDLAQAGGFDFEKIQQLQEFTLEKIQAVLNADQKAAWAKMAGLPFELKGGGGFGFKKDK